MQELAPELKPCPFCGGKARLCGYHYDIPRMFMVECDNCECAVGKDYDNSAMPDFSFGSEEKAIAAWNTRSAS